MKLKKAISNKASKIAMKAAAKSCNSTCLWFQYQPSAPKCLKSALKK